VHVWDLRAIRAIRRRLVPMGLDWDAAAFSDDDPAEANLAAFPPVRVDLGARALDIEHFNELVATLVHRSELGAAKVEKGLELSQNAPDSMDRSSLVQGVVEASSTGRSLVLDPLSHLQLVRGTLLGVLRVPRSASLSQVPLFEDRDHLFLGIFHIWPDRFSRGLCVGIVAGLGQAGELDWARRASFDCDEALLSG
jgi:hypothetical protein